MVVAGLKEIENLIIYNATYCESREIAICK